MGARSRNSFSTLALTSASCNNGRSLSLVRRMMVSGVAVKQMTVPALSNRWRLLGSLTAPPPVANTSLVRVGFKIRSISRASSARK